jgi:hypothetical protein
MRHIAGHCDARLEQLAFISLVFDRDPHRDRFQALKARRRLEVSALLAAMQSRSALGTLPFEVDPFAQQRRAAVASGSRHRLHHARQARTGDV